MMVRDEEYEYADDFVDPDFFEEGDVGEVGDVGKIPKPKPQCSTCGRVLGNMGALANHVKVCAVDGNDDAIHGRAVTTWTAPSSQSSPIDLEELEELAPSPTQEAMVEMVHAVFSGHGKQLTFSERKLGIVKSSLAQSQQLLKSVKRLFRGAQKSLANSLSAHKTTSSELEGARAETVRQGERNLETRRSLAQETERVAALELSLQDHIRGREEDAVQHKMALVSAAQESMERYCCHECSEFLPLRERCSNGCLSCHRCIRNTIGRWLGNPEMDGRVLCPGIDCRARYEDVVLERVDMNLCLRIAKVRHELSAPIDTSGPAMTAVGQASQAAVVQEAIVVCSPCCGVQIERFEGCCSIKCARAQGACRTFFCAWCFHKNSADEHAHDDPEQQLNLANMANHEHVRNCLDNPNKDKYFARQEDLRPLMFAWSQRMVQQMRDKHGLGEMQLPMDPLTLGADAEMF